MNSAARPSLADAGTAFLELVELAPAARERRLRQLAREDPALHAAVVALLRADAEGSSILDRPAGALLPEALQSFVGEAPSAEGDGAGSGSAETELTARIGPYRLVELLGRGGMGEVFLAERVDGQFEQHVALKLLKRGMDSEEILRRFLRERQILARLEHPSIARLLDGGVAGDGRPYFVMERVIGQPITDWCRERDAPLEKRLLLIAECADAVEVAHRSLVVHRDLKPSNILVTATGDVKLLDFGIAKLLGSEQEASHLTQADSRLLTPAYAAPEQILGEPVWTSTDVYSLGVVLYELLTGRLPQRSGHSTARTTGGEADTVERPSSVARRLEAGELAALSMPAREVRRLDRRLRGDLDNIVLHALRRDPQERYPSAAALAEDLRHHLGGRPITARPDRWGYRAAKFVSRHRVGVAATVLVVLSLAGGLVGTAWQAQRAERSAEVARENALRAERVKEFLIGLFEAADPEQQSGGAITAAELLEQGAKRLENDLMEEPLIQADLLEAVARIERSLGRLEPAEKLAGRALAIRSERLPPSHPGVASARATLGAVHVSQGRLEEAAEPLREAVTLLEASEPPGSLTLARVRSDLGNVLWWQGQLEEAEQLERTVYETYRDALGEDHVQTAVHLRNLGILLDELDRMDEAEAAYRKSQAVIEQALGTDHPSSAQSWSNLAVLLERRGKIAESEELHRRTLEVRDRRLGATHPSTGQALQLLAVFLLQQGRYDESEVYYERALELFRAINPKHFEVGKCTNGLGLIAERRGDYARAEAALREVVALFREVLGEDHSFVWQASGNLAGVIARQGRFDEAVALQREALGQIERLSGPASEESASALDRLGEILRRAGRPGEAVPQHRRSLELRRTLYGEEHPWFAESSYQLGADLAASTDEGERREARAHLDRAVAILERSSPPGKNAREARALLERLSAPSPTAG